MIDAEEDWRKVLISETFLSTRAGVALSLDGYRTLGDIAHLGMKELKGIPNMSKVTAAEIIRAVDYYKSIPSQYFYRRTK